MRRTYFSIFCGLFAIILQSLLVSCDEHEPTDHQLHVGYVLCDDHSCMDTQAYFSQSTKKAVGVIFAEATDEHPALAVMLQETRGLFVTLWDWRMVQVRIFPLSMAIPIPLPCSKASLKKQVRAAQLQKPCFIFTAEGKVTIYLAWQNNAYW